MFQDVAASDTRNNIQFKDLIIGGCSNGRDGFMEIKADDIILITPDTDESLPTIDTLSGDPGTRG